MSGVAESARAAGAGARPPGTMDWSVGEYLARRSSYSDSGRPGLGGAAPASELGTHPLAEGSR